MYRHGLEDLRAWLRRHGRKPLVLHGARRVGKSTLVRLFCAAEEANRDLLTVNLGRQHFTDAFADHDPSTILNMIEAVAGRSLPERGLLVLDEIQVRSPPRRTLKYSNVSPDDQSATIRRDIDLLAMARVIASCPSRSPRGETAPSLVSNLASRILATMRAHGTCARTHHPLGRCRAAPPPAASPASAAGQGTGDLSGAIDRSRDVPTSPQAEAGAGDTRSEA